MNGRICLFFTAAACEMEKGSAISVPLAGFKFSTAPATAKSWEIGPRFLCHLLFYAIFDDI
jgi:hypothetical protein